MCVIFINFYIDLYILLIILHINNIEMFEDLPEELQKSILTDEDVSLRNARLLSSTHKSMLLDEFIDNPSIPTTGEILKYNQVSLLPFSITYAIKLSNGVMTIRKRRFVHNMYQWTTMVEIYVSEHGNVGMMELDSKPKIQHIVKAALMNDSVILDAKLWYYVLKRRFSELNILVDDLRIKRIIQNIISRDRDELLKVHENALFIHLYDMLNLMGIFTGKYYKVIKNATNGTKFDIPEGMLEEMLERYRYYVDDATM